MGHSPVGHGWQGPQAGIARHGVALAFGGFSPRSLPLALPGTARGLWCSIQNTSRHRLWAGSKHQIPAPLPQYLINR